MGAWPVVGGVCWRDAGRVARVSWPRPRSEQREGGMAGTSPWPCREQRWRGKRAWCQSVCSLVLDAFRWSCCQLPCRRRGPVCGDGGSRGDVSGACPFAHKGDGGLACRDACCDLSSLLFGSRWKARREKEEPQGRRRESSTSVESEKDGWSRSQGTTRSLRGAGGAGVVLREREEACLEGDGGRGCSRGGGPLVARQWLRESPGCVYLKGTTPLVLPFRLPPLSLPFLL